MQAGIAYVQRDSADFAEVKQQEKEWHDDSEPFY